MMIKNDERANETTPTQIILVQSWFTELERLVPTP